MSVFVHRHICLIVHRDFAEFGPIAVLHLADAILPIPLEASLASLATLALHLFLGVAGYGMALHLLGSSQLQLLRDLLRRRGLSDR